jgi:hypothetical protein
MFVNSRLWMSGPEQHLTVIPSVFVVVSHFPAPFGQSSPCRSYQLELGRIGESTLFKQKSRSSAP